MALYLIKDAMRQYFIDGFFHADAHPANLALLSGDENSPDGKLAYFDFGIVGEAEKREPADFIEIRPRYFYQRH